VPAIAFVRRPCWRRWRRPVDTIAEVGSNSDRRGGSRIGAENPQCEIEAYGVPLVSPALPSRDLAESLTIIRECGRGRAVRLRRAVHPLKGAVCDAKPKHKPHPPIYRGQVTAFCASSPSTPTFGTIQDRQGRVPTAGTTSSPALRRHRRDPNDIVRSMQTILRSDAPEAHTATRTLPHLKMIDAGVSTSFSPRSSQAAQCSGSRRAHRAGA